MARPMFVGFHMSFPDIFPYVVRKVGYGIFGSVPTYYTFACTRGLGVDVAGVQQAGS
jgi:hypothetical protein